MISPPPIKVEASFKSSALSLRGIYNETNLERTRLGLPALRLADQLNIAARQKARDMIEKNYFQHISPEGKSATDFVKAAGYEYLRLGENLALGGFQSDEAVVDAWMESPGHRANILNAGFTEIGVAASEGMFEGKKVWFAVQMFALPKSACPLPDEGARARISELKIEIDRSKAELEAMLSEINNAQKGSPDIRARVEQYNQKVTEVNELIDDLEALVGVYNLGVEKQRGCLEDFQR